VFASIRSRGQSNRTQARSEQARTSLRELQAGHPKHKTLYHDALLSRTDFLSTLHHPRFTSWPTSNQRKGRSSPCAIGEVGYITTQSSHVQAVLTHHPENSVPPTLLATLITAQHARPFQALPMAFAPVLLFSSYLNLSGYKTDAAGTTAAWSGLYALLALRRRQVSVSLSYAYSACLHWGNASAKVGHSNSSRSSPCEALSVEHH